MDAVILFMVLIILEAHFVANESSIVQALWKSQPINVACGHHFNLRCEFTTNVSCTWKRNNAVIKVDSERYFTNETWYQSIGTTVTVCTFKVSEAEAMDSGNWTCGIPASDSSDKTISQIIAVNVFMTTTVTTIPSHNITFGIQTVPTLPHPNITYIVQSDSINMYVMIGVLTSVILILAMVIITWMCIKRKRTINKVNPSPSPSVHEYEVIDENAITITSDLSANHCSFNERLRSHSKNDKSALEYSVPWLASDNSDLIKDEPKDVTELVILKDNRNQVLLHDNRLSSHNYLVPSHSYENVMQNY